MLRAFWLLAVFSVLVVSGVADDLSAPQPPAVSLEAGFAHLYNLRFDRAHSVFDRFIQDNPQDPLGPVSELALCLFRELSRRGMPPTALALEARGGRAQPAARPDARWISEWQEAGGRAERTALAQLRRKPNDEGALLAVTLTYALEAHYLNLVEKRPWASLTLLKKSNRYAQMLLKRNPAAHDARAAIGYAEYVWGSLPPYARWLVRFDSVRGDKQAAITQLAQAASGARYMRPYAKLVLAGIYLREKRTTDATRLLEQLCAEFPDNTELAAELSRVHRKT